MGIRLHIIFFPASFLSSTDLSSEIILLETACLLILYFSSAALNSTVQTHFTSQVSPSTQSTERRASGEKSSPSSVGTQSIDGENHLLIQRWQVPPTSKDSESSLQSHGQPASSIFSSLDQGQAPGVTGEGAKPNATEEFSQNKDLLGQIAELTRQNALIKAQLSKFKDCSQEAGDGLHQLGTVQNIHTALDPATQGQVRMSWRDRRPSLPFPLGLLTTYGCWESLFLTFASCYNGGR